MMKTKLNTKKYPMVSKEQWDLYLTFKDPKDKDEVDPCFLGRLAALSRDIKAALGSAWKPLHIVDGFRPTSEQEIIFFARGGKYTKEKGYFWPDTVPKPKRTAARPGTSKHGFRLAIDTNTVWAKAINKTEHFDKQTTLAKYGLCKPMTKGNGFVVLEDWHIQPIETRDVPTAQMHKLMPVK
jgi:hypothetical protein